MKHANYLILFFFTTIISCTPETEKKTTPQLTSASITDASNIKSFESENEYYEPLQCGINLLNNGDFETVADTHGLIFQHALSDLAASSLWDVYNSLPGGWETVSGAGIEIQANTIASASSGKHYVELDSHSNQEGSTNSRMAQAVFLNPGTYRLIFMYRARTSVVNDNNVGVYINDEILEEVTLADTSSWQAVEVAIEIQKEGIYNIGFAAMGLDNSYGGFIDDVNLIRPCVSEDF